MSCVSSILCNSVLVLSIVNSLLIIDFSLVEKTLRIFLTHKITNVPNSQNTLKKKQSLLKSLIGYSLVICFEWQQENMPIPFCSFLEICNKSQEKKKTNLIKIMADFPSC